ncbi:MAG: prepilin-type N-terminal cleavage/methylation domain-containing protein, partial [Candidatus Acidiferrales bacterium]
MRNFLHRELGTRRGSLAQTGFTMIELIIVISIIMILATLAAGRYYQSVIRAREAALRTDLRVMREAIQHYTEDKECGPQSISDLAGTYIQEVPTDPFTGAKDWNTDSTDLLYSADQTCSGITNVHSASDKIS